MCICVRVCVRKPPENQRKRRGHNGSSADALNIHHEHTHTYENDARSRTRSTFVPVTQNLVHVRIYCARARAHKYPQLHTHTHAPRKTPAIADVTTRHSLNTQTHSHTPKQRVFSRFGWPPRAEAPRRYYNSWCSGGKCDCRSRSFTFPGSRCGTRDRGANRTVRASERPVGTICAR